MLRRHDAFRQDAIAQHRVLGERKAMALGQWKAVGRARPGVESGQRAVKSVLGVTCRHASASSVDVLSTSSRLTISFGECMYRLGIETSPVATPSRAMWMASALVAVSRPAALMENLNPWQSAVLRRKLNPAGEMAAPVVFEL